MISDYHNVTTTTMPSAVGYDSTWIIISAVLAIVGGIVAYIMFVSKENNGEYTGFLASLHEFLNFKKYFINIILKVMYLITAIFITLASFSFISVSIASFFMMLILGNIFARISYEVLLMVITIVDNVTEINKKMSKPIENSKPAAKPKKKPANVEENKE